ncbi:MAG: class I SAM-dependent methyltransferase [Pseudomonadota bacterium]
MLTPPAMRLYYAGAEAALAQRYAALFELSPLALTDRPRRGGAALPDHAPAAALFALDGRLRLGAGSGAAPACVAVPEVLRRVSLRSDLARACGLNRHRDLHVVDACAGWGIDGLALAEAGARVTLIEQQPAIWALLDDLERQHRWGQTEVVHGDAVVWLQEPSRRCDVVYLDPMFPERAKTALPNQRLQLISRLASPAVSLADWLTLALERATRRVVLKRRRRDPLLRKPDWQIVGKTVRYDVYAAS